MEQKPEHSGAASVPGANIKPETSGTPEGIDLQKLPVAQLPSAAPSNLARRLAFASIVVGGVCGGLIGFAFTDLQCNAGCTIWAGIGSVLGALVGSIGVGIVAVLTLRAMNEWESIKQKNPNEHPSRPQ